MTLICQGCGAAVRIIEPFTSLSVTAGRRYEVDRRVVHDCLPHEVGGCETSGEADRLHRVGVG